VVVRTRQPIQFEVDDIVQMHDIIDLEADSSPHSFFNLFPNCFIGAVSESSMRVKAFFRASNVEEPSGKCTPKCFCSKTKPHPC